MSQHSFSSALRLHWDQHSDTDMAIADAIVLGILRLA
jgi:hypothetical protein